MRTVAAAAAWADRLRLLQPILRSDVAHALSDVWRGGCIFRRGGRPVAVLG